MENNDNRCEFEKNPVKIIMECIIMFLVISFLVFSGLPPMRSNRGRARQKACFSNMRVIQGAIEMYNMDNSKMIYRFDDDTMDLLVKNHYLKATIDGPERECYYLSNGDLTDTGFIYCKYHGDIDGKIPCEYKEDHKKYEREHLKTLFTFAAFCMFPSFLRLIIALI